MVGQPAGLRKAPWLAAATHANMYHHLMPGTMDEAAGLIQGYIDASG